MTTPPSHVCKLFWPAGRVPTAEASGLVIGWNVRNFIGCVATVVQLDTCSMAPPSSSSPRSSPISVEAVEQCLNALTVDSELAELWRHCAGPPMVIGSWIAAAQHAHSDKFVALRAVLAERTRYATFWVTVRPDAAVPVLLESLYCCGFKYSGHNTAAQVFVFEQPASYLALNRSSTLWQDALAKENLEANDSMKFTDLEIIIRQINASCLVERMLRAKLAAWKPLVNTSMSRTMERRQSTSSSLPSDSDTEAELDEDSSSSSPRLRRRNYSGGGSGISWPLHHTATHQLQRFPISLGSPAIQSRYSVSKPPSSTRSTSDSIQEQQQPNRLRTALRLKLPIILRWALMPAFCLIMIFRILVAFFSLVVNSRLPSYLGGGSIIRKSTLLQQLDRRLLALCRWPIMWQRTRAESWRHPEYDNAAFMCFGESVVRIFVDLATGIVLGLFLRSYSIDILVWLHEAGQILHLNVLTDQIIWLMGLPAGMKLNVNLDRTLGTMVLYSLAFWDGLTTVLTPLEPHIVRGVALFGIFGFSVVIACSCDLLSLMIAHIDFVHTSFSRLYSLALGALSALWKLFRGNKRNVLKNRVDSCSYDMDQLLVGTSKANGYVVSASILIWYSFLPVLFTVLFFLFPTIAVYYLFFSLVRFLVTLVQALLWFAIIFFNHFPFFSLIVFAIDPRSLPGGIQLEVITARSFADGSTLRTTYLALHNASFPVSALFEEYKRGIMRMLEYYSIDKALLCFLYGLRYPVTPALVEDKSAPDEIISVSALWQFFTLADEKSDR